MTESKQKASAKRVLNKVALEKKQAAAAKKAPKQVVSVSTFERYARMGSSLDEIRGVMWMDRDDLEDWMEKQYNLDQRRYCSDSGAVVLLISGSLFWSLPRSTPMCRSGRSNPCRCKMARNPP